MVAAIVIAYCPVWKTGFIWDDEQVVTANPVIVGPLGLKEIWTTSAADICPLTLTTFWLEHKLWGLNPLPYHLVNVGLHAACALALWRVLLSLRIPGALLGAAIWALHPVQVESVAWISEMKNTESGLFYLLTIFFSVKGLRTDVGSTRAKGIWSHVLTFLFAFLAMASKSTTMVLPIILCLCAWWVEGQWRWRNAVKVGPILFLSLVAGVVSLWTQNFHGADLVAPRHWPERLAGVGDAIWFYLGKLIWPYPLLIVYPRWQIHPGAVVSYLASLSALLVLVQLWVRRGTWLRPWFFAYAYFIAALLPVWGLVEISYFRFSFVADHFQYLASIGPLALAGAGIVHWLSAFLPAKTSWQGALASVPLLVLGLLSWQQSLIYRSESSLWDYTLAWNPNCLQGYNAVGSFLIQRGQVNEAVVQFQKAAEANPKSAEIQEQPRSRSHTKRPGGCGHTALSKGPGIESTQR